MKNISITLTPEQVTIPSGLSHVATSWQIAKYSNFTNKYFMIDERLVDKVNLLNYTNTVDILNDDRVHYRYMLHYSNGASSNWSKSNISLVEAEAGYVPPVVIATPTVSATVTYTNNIQGELVIVASPIKFFLGSGTHTNTTYTVLDDTNNIVLSVTDETNLNMISITSDLLDDDKMYSASVVYTTNNGNISEAGKAIVNSYIVADTYYDIYMQNTLVSGRDVYFSLVPKTTKFRTIDITIEDVVTSEVLFSNLNQATLTPYITIGTLDITKDYNLVTKIKLRDGTYTVNKVVYSGKALSNQLYYIVPDYPYLNRFDYRQTINLNGITAQSSRQLFDGTILIAKNSNTEIHKYSLVNGLLVDDGIAITLPTEDRIGIQYINIIQLYNGNIIVNYASNGSNLENQKSVFKMYSYNTVTKVFTEINSITKDYEWLATGVSASMYVTPNNNVYYIPANEVDVNGNVINLSLYKLNTTTFTTTKVNDLPFTATKHVSITHLDEDNFLVYGGSTSSTLVNGVNIWNRDNNNIYKYNVTTNTFTNLTNFTIDIPTSMYNFQGYLRKDGLVAMFNSVRNGASVGDQRVVLFNPTNNEITIAANDLNDNLLYRSSISLHNGDILRITANVKDEQYVYAYVTNTTALTDLNEHIGISEVTSALLVGNGETITVENILEYSSIRITGTGKLIWNNGTTVKEFISDNLIITRDTVMTQVEYDTGNYVTVDIYNDSQLVIENY